MIEFATDFFLSFFANPSLLGIGLAIVFGAIWLLGYWLPLFKRHWFWGIMACSAMLALAAAGFVQIPLQELSG